MVIGTTLQPVLQIPTDYASLLESLIAVGSSDVTPQYVRTVTLIPAGMTMDMYDYQEPNSEGLVVFRHVMESDPPSALVLITHQLDNSPPILTNCPANYPISILGSFLPLFKTSIHHHMINNDTIDVLFTEDVQSAVMTDSFVREVYKPLIESQFAWLKAAAKGLM